MTLNTKDRNRDEQVSERQHRIAQIYHFDIDTISKARFTYRMEH
jgi:hypothetical protein